MTNGTLFAADGRVRRALPSVLGQGTNNAGESVFIGFDWVVSPGFYNGLEGNSVDDNVDGSRTLNIAHVGHPSQTGAGSQSQKLILGGVDGPFLDFADSSLPARYVLQVNFGANGTSDSAQLFRDGSSLGTIPAVNDFTLANIGFGDFSAGTAMFDRLIVATTLAEANLPGAVPLPRLAVFVDRGTGNVTLRNNSPSTIQVGGLSLESASGTYQPANWLSVNATYDNSGNSSVSTFPWQQFSATRYDLSEGSLDQGQLTSGQTVNLGAIWGKNYREDVRLTYLDVSANPALEGTLESAFVFYSGGINNAAYKRSDLNFDGVINAADWTLFKSGSGMNLSALAPSQSYALGDINGDRLHNITDFDFFATDYAAANGAGSFVAMLAAVPEPSSMLLAVGMVAGLLVLSRRKPCRLAPIAAVVLLGMVREASAVVIVSDLFNVDGNLVSGAAATAGTGWGAEAWRAPIGGAGATAAANVSGGSLSLGAENRVRRNLPAVYGQGMSNAGTTIYIGLNLQLGNFYNGFEGNLDPNIDGDGLRSIELGTQGSGNVPRLALRGTSGGTPAQITFSSANLGAVKNYVMKVNFGADGSTDNVELFVDQLSQGAVNVANFQLASVGFGAFVGSTFGPIQDITLGTSAADVFPPSLTMRVDPTTGGVQIRNDSAVPLSLSGYEISSLSSALRADRWRSLSDIGGAFPVGNGSGNGWEEGAGSSNGQINEWYLTGSSTIAANTAVYLGRAFNGSGSAQDVVFRYRKSAGSIINGFVEYGSVPTPSLAGDYNNNGVVDAADYTLWRDANGTGAVLQNDPIGGTIGSAQYNQWKNNFGQSLAVVAAAAVPEPTTGVLIMLGAAIGLAINSRPRRIGKGGLSAILAVVLCVSGASAAITVDRFYRMGEDPQENGVIGNRAGVNFGGVFFTADSTSENGSTFQDLEVPTEVNARPIYRAATRPGAPVGGRALEFDDTNSGANPADRLYGNDFNNNLASFFSQRGGLGFPGNSNPQNPIANYAGITVRGIQLWAKPDAKAFGAVRQDLVNDTYQFGIHTTAGTPATRRWAMTWGSENDDQIDGKVYESQAVVSTTNWTHVMQHSFGFGGSALYVNGVAVLVAGFDGFSGYRFHAGGANLDLTVGSSLPSTSGTFTNFFDGQLDDLKIYVAGNNIGRTPVVPEITTAGMNYGAFFLGTDNDFIAQTMAGKPDGDFDLDGDVDNTDVSLFISKWGQTRTVNGVVIGDLTSRQTLGDFNYNGRVDLGDWALLRRNHPTPAALDLAALLASHAVPEPNAVLLAALGIGAGVALRRGRGQRKILERLSTFQNSDVK